MVFSCNVTMDIKFLMWFEFSEIYSNILKEFVADKGFKIWLSREIV